jgi:hypothetical protein
MARRIGNYEAAAGGGEIPIGDIDGNSLLPLSPQAIGYEREVKGRILVTGSESQGCNMVVIQGIGIVQQATYQGRLAIVHTAGGEEMKAVRLMISGHLSLLLSVMRKPICKAQAR